MMYDEIIKIKLKILESRRSRNKTKPNYKDQIRIKSKLTNHVPNNGLTLYSIKKSKLQIPT